MALRKILSLAAVWIVSLMMIAAAGLAAPLRPPETGAARIAMAAPVL